MVDRRGDVGNIKKKDTNKAMCKSSTDENMKRYGSIENKTKKAVSKAMREKAENALTYLKNCSNRMFRLVKGLQVDSRDVKEENV